MTDDEIAALIAREMSSADVWPGDGDEGESLARDTHILWSVPDPSTLAKYRQSMLDKGFTPDAAARQIEAIDALLAGGQ